MKELIDQAIKAGLFMRYEDVNLVHQAFEFLKNPTVDMLPIGGNGKIVDPLSKVKNGK